MTESGCGDANVVKVGPGAYEVRFGPDPDQALRDIIAALGVDEHFAVDEESYQAWLLGNYAGCYSCQAAFIARATLERRNYKRPSQLEREA